MMRYKFKRIWQTSMHFGFIQIIHQKHTTIWYGGRGDYTSVRSPEYIYGASTH